MSPEIHHPENEQNIQREQQRLDELDAKRDSKINIGEEREQLTQTYINRVNGVQGHIRDLRAMIDVQKDMRAPHWQQLEQTCTTVEEHLLEHLQRIDDRNIQEEVAAFNQSIDQFLAHLTRAEISTRPAEGAEKPVPRSVDDILAGWGLRIEGAEANEVAQIKAKILNAVEHYGEEVIRSIDSRLALLKKIPDDLEAQIFGDVLSPAKAAGLLMNRQLENDELYGTLIGKPESPEVTIRTMRERGYDQLSRFNEKLKGLQTAEKNEVAGLNTRTQQKAGEEQIKRNIALIERNRQTIQDIQQEMAPIQGYIMQLDLALRVFDAKSARNSGRSEEADRIIARTWETYGADLKSIDEEMWNEAGGAISRLREHGFSETEKQLYGKDNSYDQTLQTALEAKRTVDETSDILDQLESRSTFHVTSIQSGSDFFSGKTPRCEGRAQKHFLQNFIATLSYKGTGQTLTVALSPGAKHALENIPEGSQPVLLKKVESIQVRKSGGRSLRYEILNAPHTFSIDSNHIGYVKDGEVYQSSGDKIDKETHEARGVISEQIAMQRSFSVDGYRHPIELRENMKDPYPHRLLTIRTQSGHIAEGITVSNDANSMLNQKPPEGMTLVLKRIPRSISLSTKYNGGRNGRTITKFQRVIHADQLTVADLAYARIEGDDLVTRDAKDGEEKRTSRMKVEKDREEKSRDVLRVLQRDPSIRFTMSAAVSIQKSVENLHGMLDAHDKGSARAAFVNFARNEARPMLDLINDPHTKQNIAQARQRLVQLKEEGLGVALGGIEHQIDAQIKALDGFVTVIESGETKNLLKTIMDAFKFDADTWWNWFKTDGIQLITAIVIATAAVVAVVLSFGAAAAPLWAIAAAGAAGGLIGSELGAEAGRGLHYLFNDQEGVTYTNRSLIGKKLEGQKIYNPKTGTYEELTWLGDVTLPYAKQFGFSFAITYGTMGLGQLAGSGLSKLLANSKIVEKVGGNRILGPLTRSLMRLNRNPHALEKVNGFKEGLKRFVQQMPKKTAEEFSDEAQEELLTRFLNHLDAGLINAESQIGLGTVAGFILATLKSTRVNPNGSIPYAPESGQTMQQRFSEIRAHAETKGYIVTEIGDGTGYLRLRSADGKDVVDMVPESETGKRTEDSKPADLKDNVEQSSEQKESALQLAEKGDIASLKEYLKSHDVDDATRIKLAETLLREPLNSEEQTALLEAHHKPGEIDALTQGEKTVKGLSLMRNHVFSREQAQLLLDAGLAGKNTAPTFRYNADKELLEVEASGITLKEGTEVFVSSHGESAIKGTDGKGTTIPIGRYKVEFRPDANGKNMPTLKSLDPNDTGGNYTIDFRKTNLGTFGREGSRITDTEKAETYYKKGGWKLHLTVKPENYEAVDRWLFRNHKGQYKFLKGGDAGEKDVTVYIGDRTEAESLAQRMTGDIGNLLEYNNAGRDDVLLTTRVAGRFDIQAAKEKSPEVRDISLYGKNGIPIDYDTGNLVHVRRMHQKSGDTQTVSEYERRIDQNSQNIHETLKKNYGEYYTGSATQEKFQSAVANAQDGNVSKVKEHVKSAPLGDEQRRTLSLALLKSNGALVNDLTPDQQGAIVEAVVKAHEKYPTEIDAKKTKENAADITAKNAAKLKMITDAAEKAGVSRADALKIAKQQMDAGIAGNAVLLTRA